MEPLVVTDAITIPAEELTMAAVRASGPGGQNVNKVASKVELRFDLAGSAVLSGPVKGRLRALAGNRLDQDGALLIVSQKTRDQRRNLDDARERLRDLVVQALVVPKERRPTKPTRGSKMRRLGDKHVVGERKRTRAKPSGDD